MYSLVAFGAMMLDPVRMGAHVEALRRTITSDSVLLDIGTGTGVFALVACQFGARHVYAVETSPLVQLGKQMAAANGFADRITFIQGNTTELTLPERADVIIGDLRGRLPLLDHLPTTFADAKARHLKPGGVMIPKRDVMYVTLIEAADTYQQQILTPWIFNEYNLDMSAALSMVTNESIGTQQFTPENMLVPAQVWETLEYGERTELRFGNTNRWVVEKEGTAHFVHVWFDAELYEGITYSSAPGAASPPKVYGTNTFPLSKPIELKPGNVVEVQVQGIPSGRGYIMRWHTRVFEDESASTPMINMDQSTWFATPPTGLIKRTETYVPTLSEQGKVYAFVLSEMQAGKQNLIEIAHSLQSKYPTFAKDYDEALQRVADISQQFS